MVLSVVLYVDFHNSQDLSLKIQTRSINRRRQAALGARCQESKGEVTYAREVTPCKYHQDPSHSLHSSFFDLVKVEFFRCISSFETSAIGWVSIPD